MFFHECGDFFPVKILPDIFVMKAFKIIVGYGIGWGPEDALFDALNDFFG